MKKVREMSDFEKSVYDKSKRLVKSLEYFHSTIQIESYYSLLRLHNKIKKALKVNDFNGAYELENEFEANTETPIETMW